jgi:cytochrome c
VFALAFLAIPILAQHGRYLSDSNHPSIGNPQAIAAGTKLFMGSCAGCHGPDGGGGARGPNLVRRSLWHPLSNDAIFQVVRKGKDSATVQHSLQGSFISLAVARPRDSKS